MRFATAMPFRSRSSADATDDDDGRAATGNVSGARQPARGPETLMPLESAPEFPVGDPAVVFELLPFGRVHVMLDNRIAKSGAEHLRPAQRVSCRAEENTSELQSLTNIVC